MQIGDRSLTPVAEHVYPNELARGAITDQAKWDQYLRDTDNLVHACRSCNSIKGFRKIGEFRVAGGFREGTEEEAQAIWDSIATKKLKPFGIQLPRGIICPHKS
jgi:hypothetical protein